MGEPKLVIPRSLASELLSISLVGITSTNFPYQNNLYFIIEIDKKLSFQGELSFVSEFNVVWNNSSPCSWNILLSELNSSKMKILFFNKEKWKKDRYLGEVSIHFQQLCLKASHCPGDVSITKKESYLDFPLQFIKGNPFKENSVPIVRLYFELTSYPLLLHFLKTPEYCEYALSQLTILSQIPQNKKILQYLKKELLDVIFNVLQNKEISSSIKNKTIFLIKCLVKKDDSTLFTFVKEDGLYLLCSFAIKETNFSIKAELLDSLKSFFKFINHQNYLIEQGLLDDLIGLLSVKEDSSLIIKTIELLLNFDLNHQSQMIELGIFSQLANLLFSSNIQIQTQTLAMLQFFDGNHQKELIESGIFSHLLKLLSSENVQLQLKVLGVIQSLQCITQYKYQMFEQGLIEKLLSICSIKNISLTIKVFEVFDSMIVNFESILIKLNVLKTISETLKETNLDPKLQLKGLEVLSKFNPSHSIKEGFFKILSILLSQGDILIQNKVFDIMFIVGVNYQEAIVNEGILAQLINELSKFEESIQKNFEVKENQIFSKDHPKETTQEKLEKEEESSETSESILQEEVKLQNQLPTTWICALCSNPNPNYYTHCAVCSNPSPNNSDPHISSQQDSSIWSCPSCTLLNDGFSNRCSVCDTERPISNLLTTTNFSSKNPLETSIKSCLNSVNSAALQLQKEREEKKYIVHQSQIKILQLLQKFDSKYYGEMVRLGLFNITKTLLKHFPLQKEILKTVINFLIKYQPELIQSGVLSQLIQCLNEKNSKAFLLVIKQFKTYQEEIIQNKLVGPLLQLLGSKSQALIVNFFLDFDNSWKKILMDLIKEFIQTANHQNSLGEKEKKKKKKVEDVDHVVIRQANKLLWQLEHYSLRLLKYKILSSNGGELSKKFEIKNILKPKSTMYCSKVGMKPVNIVFQCSEKQPAFLTHFILKTPVLRCDSPLQKAVVFISETLYDINQSNIFNEVLKKEQFDDLLKSLDSKLGSTFFLNMEDQSYIELKFDKPLLAKYILLKLIGSPKSYFCIEYVGFVGLLCKSGINQIEMLHIPVDIGNQLGVKRRVKTFEYTSDFDENGLLYWIGTDEGKKSTWTNPALTERVNIITSHNMYSQGMRKADIIDREGHTSCYWGNSCPQFFILDLGRCHLRCNYFTLRHGYQAPNSFMQNWTFCGSHDCLNWVTLYEGQDTPFFTAFDTKSWPVSDGKDYFRYFRVLQKGNYSMGSGTFMGGSPYLCIAGFELYGELILDE